MAPRKRKTRTELAKSPMNGQVGSFMPSETPDLNGARWEQKGQSTGGLPPPVPAGTKQRIWAADIPDLPKAVTPERMAEMLMGESGVSGTANYYGRLWTEETQELQWLLAYQIPGSGVFGQWEALERRNPYVTTALEAVKAPIRDARVDVKAAEGVENAELHAKVVEWNIKEHMRPGFARVLERMVSMLLYGFSLQEVCMEPVQHQLFGGWGLAVDKLGELLPTSVYEQGWVTQDRELLFIKQRGPVDGRFVVSDMPASKVLLSTWNRTGDNYAGFSAFRPVWYPAKIMEHAMRLQGVAMVREASGVPTAEVDPLAPTMTPGARKKLQRFLMNLVYHEQAAVVLPPGVKLNWWVSPGRDKSSLIKQYHDLGKLILFQTQSQQTALGIDETGSRAVGGVHAKTSEGFAKGVVSIIEEVLNGVGGRPAPYTGLARKIIDANFGPQVAYPKIVLTLNRSQLEPQDRADAVQKYRAAGCLTWRAADENVIREDTGLPPIDEGEWTSLQSKLPAGANDPSHMAPAQPPSAGGGGGSPPSPAGGSSRSISVVRPEGSAPVSKVEVKRPEGSPDISQVHIHRQSRQLSFEPRRALRPSEKRLDLKAIDNFLNRARDTFDTEARALAAAMLARARPQIRAAMESGDPRAVSAVKLDTTDLEAFLSRFLTQASKFGSDQVAQERQKGTGAVKDERQDGGQRLAPVPRKFAGGADEEKKRLDAMKAQMAKRIAARVQSNLENEAINAERTGGDEDDAISETMDDLMTSGAFKADAGMLVTKAFNMGREEFAAEHGDEVESVELSAILDSAVCAQCDSLDGSTYDFESAEHLAHIPPLAECDGGDQCRCCLLYNFKDDSSADEGEQ